MTLTKVLVYLRLAQLVYSTTSEYSPPFFNNWVTVLLMVIVIGIIILKFYFDATERANLLNNLLKWFTRISIPLPYGKLTGGF